MFAKLIVAGYVGADAELRYTSAGIAVLGFSLASSRRWRDADGSPHEVTTWFRVSAWRKTAEALSPFIKKGKQVLVEGELTPDPKTGGPRFWEGNDGTKRASYEVNALTVRLLGKAEGNGNGDGGTQATAADAAPAVTEDANDMPF